MKRKYKRYRWPGSKSKIPQTSRKINSEQQTRGWTGSSEEDFTIRLNNDLAKFGLGPVEKETTPDKELHELNGGENYHISFVKKGQPGQYFDQLKKLLLKLKDNAGWFVMNTPGNLYCQLRKYEDQEEILFEAVSHFYHESLDPSIKNSFIALGFSLIDHENYSKEIILNNDGDIHNTALEIMKIFEEIYGVRGSTHYYFNDQIDILNPKVGDDIYVDTSLYVTHGVDDFIGGLCKVSKVEKAGNNTWIEVKEDEGAQHNWAYLKEMQSELRREFGLKRGYHRPDYRQEFNEL